MKRPPALQHTEIRATDIPTCGRDRILQQVNASLAQRILVLPVRLKVVQPCTQNASRSRYRFAPVVTRQSSSKLWIASIRGWMAGTFSYWIRKTRCDVTTQFAFGRDDFDIFLLHQSRQFHWRFLFIFSWLPLLLRGLSRARVYVVEDACVHPLLHSFKRNDLPVR